MTCALQSLNLGKVDANLPMGTVVRQGSYMMRTVGQRRLFDKFCLDGFVEAFSDPSHGARSAACTRRAPYVLQLLIKMLTMLSVNIFFVAEASAA